MGVPTGGMLAGRAFVSVHGHLEPLVDDLKGAEKTLQDWVQGIGQKMTAWGSGITVGLIGAVHQAAKQAAQFNAFEQVFQGANQEADRLATTLSDRVGRSLASIASTMAPIGKMARGLGMAAGEAAKFSEAATAAALDISSFFNIGVEDAAARILSALSGSSQAVKQFGITLNAAAVSAELVSMGLDGNIQKASEYEKTLARLNIIQHALAASGATGDLERNQERWGNLIRAQVDAMKRLAAAIGQAVLPLAEQFLGSLVKVTQAMAGLLERSPELIRILAAVAAGAVAGGIALMAVTSSIVMTVAPTVLAAVALGKLAVQFNLVGVASQVATAGVRGFATATAFVGPAVSKILPYLAKLPVLGLAIKAATVAAGVALSGLALPMTAVAAVIASVGAGLYLLHKRTGALQPLLDAFSAAGSRIAAVWGQNIAPIFEKLGTLWRGLVRMFLGDTDSWVSGIQSLADLLGQGLVAAVEVAAGVVAMLADEISGVIDWINKLFGFDLEVWDPRVRSAEKQADAGQPGRHSAFKDADELQRFADGAQESTRTSLEQYQTYMAKLTEAFAQGAIDAETFRRARDQALQDLWDTSPEKAQADAMRQFGEQLVEQTKTPLEAFEEQMDRIVAAFDAGAVTGEVAVRAQQQALEKYQEFERRQQEEIDRAAREAEKEAERERKDQLDAINKRADRDSKIAKALGDDQGAIAAAGRKVQALQAGGFKEESLDAEIARLGMILKRSEDLDKEVARERDDAAFITSSRTEALAGLGTKTVNDKLLDEAAEARKVAVDSRDRLEKISKILLGEV